MIVIKAHRAILFNPIFWNFREQLKRLFGKLELDAQMLQQVSCEWWGEQEGTSRMHLGAKIERVKWKDLFIEGAVEVAYLEVVVSHLRRDNIPCIVKSPKAPQLGAKRSVYFV